MSISDHCKALGRWSRRKEARPEEIINAALDLFVERGFAATKIEDIAKRAGVTRGTPYLYFSGKEDILAAVIRESIVPCLTEAATVFESHTGSAADLLILLLRGWWELIGATRLSGIPKLMIAESGNFPELTRYYHEQVIMRGSALIARAIQRGVDLGEFRAVDVDVVVKLAIAPLMLAMLWKHSFACCLGEQLDVERYLRANFDLLINGLQANPSPVL